MKLSDIFVPLLGKKVALHLFLSADITPTYISWLNNERVTCFSNQRFLKHSQDSCETYFKTFQSSNNLFISIRDRVDGRAIGTMTVYFSTYHGTADIGILLGDQTIWGNGYGQDAWDTMVDWLLGLETVRKVTAGTLACHKGMISLMERSGMILEAARKAQEIVEGCPIDILYYAKFHDS